jgi:hypothetical protein
VSRVVYLRSGHRPPPALLVHVGVEEKAFVHVVAGTDLDAARLLGWLDRSHVLDQLPDVVGHAIDQLRLGDEDAA